MDFIDMIVELGFEEHKKADAHTQAFQEKLIS